MSGTAVGNGARQRRGLSAPGTGSGRWSPLTRQAGSFVGIGFASSVANAAVFLLMRSWFNAETATVIAVTLTTLLSTEANRRLTFPEARTSRSGLVVQTIVVILFYCTYNTVALWVLYQVTTAPSAQMESLTLLVASTFGGVARFVLLRAWVFRNSADAAPVETAPAPALPALPVAPPLSLRPTPDERAAPEHRHGVLLRRHRAHR